MTKEERVRLFEWITKCPAFDTTNEDCQLFYARFNPENQFLVSCFYGGKAQKVECFRFNDAYYTSRNRCVMAEYIKEVKPLRN